MKNFGYLVAAYMVIWTALFMYIIYLFRKNKELREELQALQTRVEQIETKNP